VAPLFQFPRTVISVRRLPRVEPYRYQGIRFVLGDPDADGMEFRFHPVETVHVSPGRTGIYPHASVLGIYSRWTDREVRYSPDSLALGDSDVTFSEPVLHVDDADVSLNESKSVPGYLYVYDINFHDMVFRGTAEDFIVFRAEVRYDADDNELDVSLSGEAEIYLPAAAHYVFKEYDVKCSPTSSGYKCTGRFVPRRDINVCRDLEVVDGATNVKCTKEGDAYVFSLDLPKDIDPYYLSNEYDAETYLLSFVTDLNMFPDAENAYLKDHFDIKDAYVYSLPVTAGEYDFDRYTVPFEAVIDLPLSKLDKLHEVIFG